MLIIENLEIAWNASNVLTWGWMFTKKTMGPEYTSFRIQFKFISWFAMAAVFLFCFVKDLFILSMCINLYSTCMYMQHGMCLMPTETRRRCQIFWNWSDRQWTARLSSERTTATFNCWAISPTSAHMDLGLLYSLPNHPLSAERWLCFQFCFVNGAAGSIDTISIYQVHVSWADPQKGHLLDGLGLWLWESEAPCATWRTAGFVRNFDLQGHRTKTCKNFTIFWAQ